MRDAYERVESPGEDADAKTEARPAATPEPKPAGSSPPTRNSGEKAGAGRPFTNETARLVCAASVAVALGVACGLWINARLASAASAFPHVQNRLLPESHAGLRAADAPPVMEPTPAGLHDGPASPAGAATSHGPEETADAAVPGEAPVGDAGKDSRETRGANKTAEPSAPKAYEADETTGRGKVVGRGGGESAVKSRAGAAGARGVEAPCAPYTSAGALNIRGGGAATVVIGGPGRQGRVTVATPNWSDIVVLSEGPAGGGGWMKYSVKSVSGRPGVYAVHVRTPCGAQTIPVTVGRP